MLISIREVGKTMVRGYLLYFYEGNFCQTKFKEASDHLPFEHDSFVQVGSIIELRRSYQAYNVMPSLSKALRRYGV